jgi:hypothetical protein
MMGAERIIFYFRVFIWSELPERQTIELAGK